MKFNKLKLKTLSMKRKREITYMIGAVLLILIGIPLGIQLIQSFNDVNALGTFEIQNEEDFRLEPFGQTQARIGLLEITGDGRVYTALNTTVYGILEHTTALECSTSPTDQKIYWFLNYTAMDLLEGNHFNIQYDMDVPDGDYNVKLVVYHSWRMDYWPEEGSEFRITEDYLTFNENRYIYSQDHSGDNLTGWINLTISDLLQVDVEHPNKYLALVVENENADWETGDIITWTVKVYDPSSEIVDTMTVLRYGALIMGVILIMVGFASTPWWNPTDPDRKGWFDRTLDKVVNRRKKK